MAGPSSPEENAIAIVGIGCRFPGGVVDPASFWRLLSDGVDAIGPIPPNRMDLAHYYDARPATPGRTTAQWGGFLDKIDEFDAAFFSISPREAERIDPQQRLLLETAWEALEDAGQDTTALAGTPTGVFIGQWLSDFEARLFANPENTDFYMTTGSGRYATSGRISYALDLQGPSLTLDTACSSSLAAVHLACQSLRSGETSLALAGGVNVILQPHISIAYSQSRMMAPDGRCKFGDASGDGYVRSEGAGIVVLKPLARAVADGDRVYAVIRGSAVNNDGRTSGSMGTPGQVGQEALLRQAYSAAGVEPARVGYIEAHGTGTLVGDPVELGALGSVLREGRADGAKAFVGSVKTNVGHTEGAAGVAGLIKAALSLHHGVIPASLHCRQPNPAIPWADLPLQIARDAVAWPNVPGRVRVAGVSAFGIAGTNAHVVLEEAQQIPAAPRKTSLRAMCLLPLSARSTEALHVLANRYAEYLSSPGELALEDASWSAAVRRTALDHRAAFVAPDRAAMAAALRAYGAGVAPAAEGVVRSARQPRVVFVCPGQGAQWVGMARELITSEPVFRGALEECDAAARPYAEWSIVDQLEMESSAPGYRLDQIDVIQPVLVALAIAYARLWRARGVEPDAVVGHSMGEVAAAQIAGVLDLDQAIRIVCRRSALMRRTSGQGAMALVDLSMDDAQARLAGFEDRVTVAVSNSPRSSVISGDAEAVRELLKKFEADGIFCRLIKVDVASHSPQMDQPAADLVRELSGMTTALAAIPIFSTVFARRAEGSEFGAAYWGRNLREPVRFGSCIEALLAEHASVFVELGPHPVLTVAVEQTAQTHGADAVALACGVRDESDVAAMLTAAGGLWAAGVAIDWTRVLPAGRIVPGLPTYPWQRERHWVREAEIADARRAAQPSRPVLSDEQREWLHAVHWVEAPALVAQSAGQRPGSLLLIAGSKTREVQSYGDALSGDAPVRVMASMDEAIEQLRNASQDAVTAIVLLASGVDENPHGAISLLQSLADADVATNRVRFTIATIGAQAVGGHARPRVDVDHATLWGVGRVIAEEHPDLWGGLIDLDPASDLRAQAAQLVAEVFRGSGETQVALRDGKRFVLRLKALDAEPADDMLAPWPNDGAWLITGGLGEVGLQLAAGMVAQGVRRLVLLGRSALPPRAQWITTASDTREGRRIAAIRALEAAGAAVHVLVADVADAADLERALKSYEREAWPPIRGVLHAAGVLETALLTQADSASLQRVLAPKLQGARNLDRLLPNAERFVMISSFSATLGVSGMANYSAANAGLDALAQDRRARGLHGLSIQSGPWNETGMNAGESAEQNMRQLNDMGIHGHTTAQGVAIFDAVAGRGDAGVIVMPIDWSAFTTSRRGRNLKLYEDRVANRRHAPEGGAGLGERLAVASAGERRQLIEPLVREAVGRVLKLAPARIDPRKALGTMGLNSLMAMELRNRLESALGRPLSATLAWNYPTVEALTGFLCGAAPAPAVRQANGASEANGASAPSAVGVDAVASLSDADAARLLRRKR